MQAVEALTGIATTARRAAVAGGGGVVEILAAGALHQIAGNGGGIAQLRRSTREQCLRHGRKAAGERRIVGEVAVADERADANAAVSQPLDAVETVEAGDIDDALGSHDVTLHQVEQVGTAGEVDGAGRGGGVDGLTDGGGAYIIEWLHAACSVGRAAAACAARMASTIPT